MGLCRRGSGGAVLLDDVTLAVRPGDRLALVGRSGAGKTVLMRAMCALDPLAGGQINWRGQRVGGATAPQFRSRVVYLPQRTALLEGSVEDNLRAPFSLAVHQGRTYDRGAAIAYLKIVDRDESFLDKRRDDLSGGEGQIVALVRALQLEPEVLLLDEPTAALDADTAAAAESLVLEWLAEAPAERALIWSSHDAEQTERVATRQLHMADGRLIE